MTKLPSRVLMVRAHLPQIKALCAGGMRVTVLWDKEQAWRIKDEIAKTSGVRFVEWKRIHIPGVDFIRLILIVARILINEKIQVVHVNALRDLPAIFLAAHILSFPFVRPIIVSMARDPRTWQKPRRAWLASRLIMYFSDGFVALSSVHRDQLLSLGVPDQVITVIPNPYDYDWVESLGSGGRQEAFSEERIRIVYIATLCPRKGQDILVKAAALVTEKYENVEFLLIGEEGQGGDYKEYLRFLINKLNLEKHVVLTGHIPHLELGKKLLESDIIAFPTKAEMMPRAVIEAMIVERPVIASGVDGILDLIEDEETGLIVPPGDVKELANGILRLIEHPLYATDIARSGQEFASSYCNPRRVGCLFRCFYDQILKRRGFKRRG